MVQLASVDLVKQTAEDLKKQFQWRLIAALIGVLFSAATVGLVWHFMMPLSNEKPMLETQLKKLTQTENNLRDLLVFVESQKADIAYSQYKIQTLKAEREKLQPVVNSDKRVLEALLAAQEERNQSQVWRERAIGLIFGIVGSLIAAVIYSRLARFFEKARSSAS